MKIIDDLYQEDINYATRFRNLHIIFSSFSGILAGVNTYSFVCYEHTPLKLAIATPLAIFAGVEVQQARNKQKELKKIKSVKAIVEKETADCFKEEVVKAERKEKFRIIK